MGWDTYSLKDPMFCQPLHVMRGLVSALVERRFPVVSGAYSSAINSGSAYYTSALNRMLNGQAYIEYPFKRVARVGTHSANVGIFAYEMDYQIDELLNYGNMQYCDSNGFVISSVADLAQMATGSALISTSRFERCLDVEWAKQRQKMLEFLHFTTTDSGGLWIDKDENDNTRSGATVQSAYNDLPANGWSSRTHRYTDIAPERAAIVNYYRNSWDTDYYIYSAYETTCLSCTYGGGILMPQNGELRFDAVAPSGWGGTSSKFHPLNNTGTKTIVSGANVLQLETVISSGNYASAVFGSWGHGNANLGAESCAQGEDIIAGWQMQNVKIIYDYDSVFEFNSLT